MELQDFPDHVSRGAVIEGRPFIQAWMLRHPDQAVLDHRYPTTQVTD